MERGGQLVGGGGQGVVIDYGDMSGTEGRAGGGFSGGGEQQRGGVYAGKGGGMVSRRGKVDGGEAEHGARGRRGGGQSMRRGDCAWGDAQPLPVWGWEGSGECRAVGVIVGGSVYYSGVGRAGGQGGAGGGGGASERVERSTVRVWKGCKQQGGSQDGGEARYEGGGSAAFVWGTAGRDDGDIDRKRDDVGRDGLVEVQIWVVGIFGGPSDVE